MEAVEYQDGVKLMDSKRGGGFKESTVVNSSKRYREEEESVGTETLNEPGHSHCTV